LPQVKRALGKGIYKEFVIENVPLIDPEFKGAFGTRVLRVGGEPAERPLGYSNQLATESRMLGKKTEIFEISKRLFNKLRVRFKIITDYLTQEMRTAKQENFANIVFSAYQDERREKALGLKAKLAGLNPEEWVKQPPAQPAQSAGIGGEQQNALNQQLPGNVLPAVKQQINAEAQAAI